MSGLGNTGTRLGSADPVDGREWRAPTCWPPSGEVWSAGNTAKCRSQARRGLVLSAALRTWPRGPNCWLLQSPSLRQAAPPLARRAIPGWGRPWKVPLAALAGRGPWPPCWTPERVTWTLQKSVCSSLSLLVPCSGACAAERGGLSQGGVHIQSSRGNGIPASPIVQLAAPFCPGLGRSWSLGGSPGPTAVRGSADSVLEPWCHHGGPGDSLGAWWC